MNFDFSDDQRLVQSQVRGILCETCPTTAIRRVLEGESEYVEESWAKLGELGYLGVDIPEAYGGSGLGALELCLVAEEAGRVLAPLPLSSSLYLAAPALLVAGSEEQKLAWLPGLASGRIIGTAALSGVDGVFGIENRVRWEDGFVSGSRVPVPDAGIADVAVVLVDHEDGPALALVRLDQPGVKRERVGGVDPTRPCTQLRLERASAELLGEPGAAGALVDEVRDRAAVLIGFEQLGGADAALEMAREYATTRYAFGRQIGSYQAIKHKLADVYVRNQIARGHCYFGAWALSSDAPDLPLAAAGVRVAATRAFELAAQENVQTHGGVGFTWEFDCHLFYRRSRHLALTLGGIDTWRERLVSRLESRNAA